MLEKVTGEGPGSALKSGPTDGNPPTALLRAPLLRGALSGVTFEGRGWGQGATVAKPPWPPCYRPSPVHLSVRAGKTWELHSVSAIVSPRQCACQARTAPHIRLAWPTVPISLGLKGFICRRLDFQSGNWESPWQPRMSWLP